MQVIFKYTYDLFNTDFNLFGHNISFMNCIIFSVIAGIVLFVLGKLLDLWKVAYLWMN